jgi:hypothetical protein
MLAPFVGCPLAFLMGSLAGAGVEPPVRLFRSAIKISAGVKLLYMATCASLIFLGRTWLPNVAVAFPLALKIVLLFAVRASSLASLFRRHRGKKIIGLRGRSYREFSLHRRRYKLTDALEPRIYGFG